MHIIDNSSFIYIGDELDTQLSDFKKNIVELEESFKKINNLILNFNDEGSTNVLENSLANMEYVPDDFSEIMRDMNYAEEIIEKYRIAFIVAAQMSYYKDVSRYLPISTIVGVESSEYGEIENSFSYVIRPEAYEVYDSVQDVAIIAGVMTPKYGETIDDALERAYLTAYENSTEETKTTMDSEKEKQKWKDDYQILVTTNSSSIGNLANQSLESVIDSYNNSTANTLNTIESELHIIFPQN